METIHGNMHVLHMYVSMYFLHLVLTLTPHYIITDKGLLDLVQEKVIVIPGSLFLTKSIISLTFSCLATSSML